MVVLAPNFAVLASLSALAAMLLAPVNGVAIPNSPYRDHSSSAHRADEAAKFDKHRSRASTQGSSEADNGLPLPIPLPGVGRRYSSKQQGKRWDPLDPLLQVGGLYIGDHPEPAAVAKAESFAIGHQNSRVRISNADQQVHTVHRPSGERVELIVNGNNEHIRLQRSPEPRHRDHDDDRHNHRPVIVSGDNDNVRVHEKREPRHHHRHGSHHHHSYHWRRDTNGSSLPLLDPAESIVAPLGRRAVQHPDSEDHRNQKRRVGESDAVPGVIDIISNVAGSKVGQRLASLVLDPAVDGANSTEPFVLNASGTNQTQVYLVVLSDGEADPATTGNSGSTAMQTGPSPSNNATASVAQSLGAPASTSLDAHLSASIASTNSSLPSNSTALFKKVALQVSIFDPIATILKTYCATFDPRPSKPSPLRVEDCTDGVVEGDHTSQVFAYDPNTGIIQPMWFNGEDDGMPDDDDEDSGLGDTTSENSSASAATPGDTSSSSDEDASDDVGAAVARLNSLDRELVSDASGARNFATTGPQSFASDSYNAQNVTLKFTPSVPVLPQANSQAEQEAVDVPMPSSSSDMTTATFSSSSSTASATGSGSAVSSLASSTPIAFASGSASSTSAEPMTPSAVLSPAAVASVMPNDSTSGSASTTLSSSISASETDSGVVPPSSVASSGSGSSAAPTASDHGLRVEVYDPNASTPSAMSFSVTGSVSSTYSSSISAATTSSVSGTSDSSAPSMTPVSTAPYEWMFRETTTKEQ